MADATAPHAIKILKPGPEQNPARDSFLGGQPRLPPGLALPSCKNCRAILTFFFQVAFPEGHDWAGQTLAVFECTACRDEGRPTPFVDQDLIPPMERMNLRRGEDVPDGALDLVQGTFRLLVFAAAEGVIRGDYEERVGYRPIALRRDPEAGRTKRSRVGGLPGWVQGIDSTPGGYLGDPLAFLMQWRHDFSFDRVAGSPAPFNPFEGSLPGLTDDVDHYRLFQGTQLYFFGNRAGGRPHVYMIPRVP